MGHYQQPSHFIGCAEPFYEHLTFGPFTTFRGGWCRSTFTMVTEHYAYSNASIHPWTGYCASDLSCCLSGIEACQ